MNIFNSTFMEQSVEQQPRYLGENYAEFLGAMKYLSGQSNRALARSLGTNKDMIGRHLEDRSVPSADMQVIVRDVFGLSQSEMDGLVEVVEPITYPEPLSPEERRNRGEYLGKNFAEFLGAMKYLSGHTNQALANGLETNKQAIREYLRGQYLPGEARQAVIREVFGLNQEEMDGLVTPEPIIYPDPLNPQERRDRNEYLGLDLAEFLRTMSYLSGKSARDMAPVLGVEPTAVRRYLTGTSQASPAIRKAIKRTFGLSSEEFESLVMEPSLKTLVERDLRFIRRLGATSWRDFANCKEVDRDIFFIGKRPNLLKARNICRYCKVSRECLQFALSTPNTEGIWGGTNDEQRAEILKDSPELVAVGK